MLGLLQSLDSQDSGLSIALCNGPGFVDIRQKELATSSDLANGPPRHAPTGVHPVAHNFVH